MIMENVKLNRYELYGKSEIGKVVDVNLKMLFFLNFIINIVGLSVLSWRNFCERGFILYVKEFVVLGKDDGNLNLVFIV